MDSSIPDFAAKRPVAWGASAGFVMAAVGQLLFEVWVLSAAVGAIFGIFNWFLWRTNGPARPWRSYLLRRFRPSSPE